MIGQLLLFLAGAAVGLLLRRNEVVVDARSKAVELLIELEVLVELWPTDISPIAAAGSDEDRNVRALLGKLTHWLTVAGIAESRAYSMCEAADAVWRGYPRNQRISYRQDVDVDESNPYRHYLGLTMPVTFLELTANDWKRPSRSIRRAVRAVYRSVPEIYIIDDVDDPTG